MRKKERVKFYSPVIIGVINLYFICSLMSGIGASDNTTAQVVGLLVWCGMTAWGVVRMDKLIDVWDKNDTEEDE